MYKLLEEYIETHLSKSKPEVKSYKTEGGLCIFVYTHQYNSTGVYDKGEVNSFELLEFIYNKISIK